MDEYSMYHVHLVTFINIVLQYCTWREPSEHEHVHFGVAFHLLLTSYTTSFVCGNTLFIKLCSCISRSGNGQVSVQEAPYPSMSTSIPFTTFFSKPSKLHALNFFSVSLYFTNTVQWEFHKLEKLQDKVQPKSESSK